MPDTAIFFAVAIAPPSGYTLTPLLSLTDNSLCSWYTPLRFVNIVNRGMFLHHKPGYSPVVHMENLLDALSYRNHSYSFSIRNLPIAIASFFIRAHSFPDASRLQSAGAPLKSQLVEQVPPCVYTGQNLLGIASPSPSRPRLWVEKYVYFVALFFTLRLNDTVRHFILSQLFQ